jgi:hypothetical protein
MLPKSFAGFAAIDTGTGNQTRWEVAMKWLNGRVPLGGPGLASLGLASLALLAHLDRATVCWPPAGARAASAAPLPRSVKVVWDLRLAHREETATRERVCLNGLWRWQPAEDPGAVPVGRWGYFKVPGFWPGNTTYLQEDSQTLYTHPAWKGMDLRGLRAAWYQREFTVPRAWAGRRIAVSAEYVNSLAVVYLDGKKAGTIRYPAGEVDLTGSCRPGHKHVLSLHVVALPLRSVLLSHADTAAGKKVRGSVGRRGLCGDVYLVSTPPTARLGDVKIDPSVRKGEVTVSAALAGLASDVPYVLRVEFRARGRRVHAFTSKPFQAGDLEGGRIAVTEKWKPGKLWDLHTPENQLSAQVALVARPDKLLDTYYSVPFGFREFWIAGRDFFLNGTRLYLSAVPLDNAQIGARTATYAAARETLERLRGFGINFVYTHNYGCEPGSHLSFAELLRAADDVGMLVALSQPHFAHYDWKAPDAERTNGYAGHAGFYVCAAGSHPSVVAYAMSHNATGYEEDMNPDLLGGRRAPRDRWSRNNAALALRAEAIVKGLDGGRIVYHHASGNLGSMHTSNFYPNFVPVQELSDWLGTWATKGVKPLFLCEYGAPFSWDWAMYRGWYRGKREFGSAKVPWEFCLAEWDAQFLGDRAFRLGEAEKANLRWEARQFRAGKLWHRWDYPHPLGSSGFADREAVWAEYLSDNWRAHRTWGLSANSPWEYAAFWKLRSGVDRRRKELKVSWQDLQKPGFTPDYVERRHAQMSLDFARSDWEPTAAAQALLRNNRPLLAYLAGKAEHFTSKDHNFRPGEVVEKQLILINNSRSAVSCECAWSLDLPRPVAGRKKVTVRTGEQKRLPLRFDLPAGLPPGGSTLSATVRFDTGQTQKDSSAVHVLPGPAPIPLSRVRIALLDPGGQTGKLLADLGVRCERVRAAADLSGYDVLVVGKQALTPDGAGPDVERVRAGLKVVVFEQTAKVLEERFGFRVAEYGLRRVFPRVPDHPLLAGLKAEHWRDWRGAATLLPPRLAYTLRPRYGPTVRWCGLEVPRAWRCGCRGSVASVLIEKPARGDFLAVLDGGFALQYSPLLEYREGKGMVLFCQADVTGRTEADPAAEALTRNLLRYVATWKPRPARKAVYVGDPAGRRHLEAAGFAVGPYVKGKLPARGVLVVGPGGGAKLAGEADLGRWLKAGGRLLALGLDETDVAALPSPKVTVKQGEHVAAYFEAPGVKSLLAGVGPADVHNRDPRRLPLVRAGASVLGNGVLAVAEKAEVVFCQLVPWQFEPKKQMNLKRTFRTSARLVSRLAANLGVAGQTPLLSRFRSPVKESRRERRWLTGFYLDVPEEWDDPYRFFRW